jgi:hypothetical protein
MIMVIEKELASVQNVILLWKNGIFLLNR